MEVSLLRWTRHLVVLAAASLIVSFVAVPAAASTTRRGDIQIRGDEAFTKSNGVRSGHGTKKSPYVISGWQVSNITLRDTSAYVVIKGNQISSRLTLNWNGDRVKIIDNEVGDLRVNQNVERTGAATSGLIARNTFGSVGQLRHFDGIFERNTVGRSGSSSFPYFESRAVLLDGFNGARFRNNTIYGAVDVNLHGHHHGSSFDEDSHHHGHGSHEHDGGGMDHSKRFHQVRISGNVIHADGGWALRYFDFNHPVNDTTAASEENEELRKKHWHRTKVTISGNRLVGAGLMVDVFNARNNNHLPYRRGSLTIANNRITTERAIEDVARARHGIHVRQAQVTDLRIASNEIRQELSSDLASLHDAPDAGIRIDDLENARVWTFDNRVVASHYGIHASRFSSSVQWWIRGLKTEGVRTDVHQDSVQNPPREKKGS